MKRIFTLLLFSLILVGHAFADEVTFVASAPKSVVVNKSFKLEYTVNSQSAGQPVFPEFKGFEILMGPMISSYSSTRIVNGKSSSDSGTRFTYTLLPKAAGEYTIPGARIEAGGKSITSNSVTIKVLKEDCGQKDRGSADEVTFVASAPRSVVVNKSFKLKYEVNSKDAGQPVLPDFKGFEILSGPTTSSYSSTHIVNGKKTSYSVTFTYILLPKAAGEYTIPGARIEVGGKSITSNSVTIKVLEEDSGQKDRGSSATIEDGDIFIVATVSRTKVYEDEALQLTYKLYTLHDIESINGGKVPQFDNFYSTVISSPSNLQFELDDYKGRNYYSAVIAELLLQPQKCGKLRIEPMNMDVVVIKRVNNQDPFSFFHGIPEPIRIKKSLKSNVIEIDVKALRNGAQDSLIQ